MFSLAVGLMVILVAAFWAFQGFFGAIIMFFEAVVALMVAFGFYEPINGLWAESLGSMGPPVALMGLFVATLVILRVITDKIIPTGIRLPVWADRAGGGVCGFFTGMILIGIALVSVQMLPIGPTLFGFERLTADDDGLPVQNNMLFNPDGFAIGMANMLSNNRLGGETPLSSNRPDMLLDICAGRAAPQPEARVDVPARCLKVESFWKTGQLRDVHQRSTNGKELQRTYSDCGPQDAMNTFMVCRVRLEGTASHEHKKGEVRFRLPQFRIVGPPPGASESSTTPHVYMACGMTDIFTHQEFSNIRSMQPEQAAEIVRFSPTTDLILSLEQTKPVAETSNDGKDVKAYLINVAFEVPDDFVPWYVEFKRGGRFDMTGKKPIEGDQIAEAKVIRPSAPPAEEGDQESSKAAEVGKAPGGPFQVAIATDAEATSSLPIVLSTSDQWVAKQLRRKKIRKSSWAVNLPKDPSSVKQSKRVAGFQVPSDMRMVQVYASKAAPKSALARSISMAANVASSITISGNNGKTYFALGKYAVVPMDNKFVFEVQYDPKPDMPERCLKPFTRITAGALRNADPNQKLFVYLFLVDPGIEITQFSAGKKTQKLKLSVPD